MEYLLSFIISTKFLFSDEGFGGALLLSLETKGALGMDLT